MKIKDKEWTLVLIYVFNVLLVKKISGQKKSPKTNDIIPLKKKYYDFVYDKLSKGSNIR